ncbi:sugar phosphate isomerase/epimerase family protein [Paenibacillus eucommiae]|uniref:Sugar phosphate isomerase/epimerase n=1 Tax=Paenibacillus eucommiae TaxID=1355755 RepID=A0ABS4J6B8_9BACL|nr:TIM barrel protein [Paenibacillus eucommiae]MBP1995357.1 sugar phosphate isomerase/epimerase [Paenibacillus eucommiae]
MKICIGGFSFFNTMNEGKMDTFGYLESSKYRYNLSSVDLWNGSFLGTRQDIFKLPEEDYIQKLREALDEKEMTVINFAVDGAHLWDADPDKRKMLYSNAVAYLKIADTLGAKTIRIDTGDKQSVPVSEEQFEYTVKQFQDLSVRAADLGLVVGPENHMGSSQSPHYLKRVAEAVNQPNFGILLHMGRWSEDQEIGDILVAPWVYHTHFDGKTVGTDRGAQLVQTLLDAGYEGYWGIEYNAPSNQYLEMEWAIASVKRILTHAGKND